MFSISIVRKASRILRRPYSLRSPCFTSSKVSLKYYAIRSLSGKEPVPGSIELHQSYQDQLKELESERIELFGSNASSTQSSPNASSSASPAQNEMEMTLEEMNKDREDLYAFTNEEKAAWGSSGSDQALSAEFLDAVNKAREAKAIYEQSLEKGMEEKMSAIVEEGEQNRSQLEEIVSPLHVDKEGGDDAVMGIEIVQPFTHLNEKGNASMVDVGKKESTRRVAVARSSVLFPPEVMDVFGINLNDGSHEMIGKKGPIFSTARLAGIMGAKRTADLIPLCHPLPLEKIRVDIRLEGNRALIECECCVTHKTGVEMEALVGASIAALTIYDMVKAVSHQVRIETTELVTKKGGKRTIEDGHET